MATQAVVPEAPTQRDPAPDATPDNPQRANPDQIASATGISKEMQDALKLIRRTFKDQYAPKRDQFLRRARRAYEFLKNNPYITQSGSGDAYDTLNEILSGQDAGVEDAALYQHNDNLYQVCALSCIAALSPDVPKARFQPVDADDEEDLLIAQKASTIQADNERRNGIRALQKQELLALWCTGSYFCYVRNIVDKNRAGVTKRPIIEMGNVKIVDDRYLCPQCGEETPADQQNMFSTQMNCGKCNAVLGQSDFYEGYEGLGPVKTGEENVANSMTAFDVLSGLFIDADPDAMSLYESAILDYEGESSIAAVRAAFPTMFSQIQQTADSSDQNGSTARQARDKLTNPGGKATTTNNTGTYSRCWIQPWAYYILDDEGMVAELQRMFPDGVKYVSYDNGEMFLQAVPEALTTRWTWCGTIKGLGLYPFGIGDAALDIQVRINDCANTVHAYMDRLAFGTIIYDADFMDWDAMSNRGLTPGNGTGVSRKGDSGVEKSLEDMIFQPQFHIDGNIYTYEASLVQKIQLISGVMPQIFSGSDPNIQTKGGQEQALSTALGRLKLFWDQIREEHASRAEISVRCTVENMDEQHRVVMEGEADSDWETQTLLKSELTGDFLAYAESDEGFPASYQEIQARIMELMGHIKDNPFLGAVLQDPDTQKIVARYILPEQIKLPNDSERQRVKLLCKRLSQGQPIEGPPGPDGKPVLMPSISLSQDYDDFSMATQIATQWLQKNWQTLNTNPNGFNNVLALLKQASTMQTIAQAKQQLAQAAQQGGAGEGGPGAAPPPGLPAGQ